MYIYMYYRVSTKVLVPTSIPLKFAGYPDLSTISKHLSYQFRVVVRSWYNFSSLHRKL